MDLIIIFLAKNGNSKKNSLDQLTRGIATGSRGRGNLSVRA